VPKISGGDHGLPAVVRQDTPLGRVSSAPGPSPAPIYGLPDRRFLVQSLSNCLVKHYVLELRKAPATSLTRPSSEGGHDACPSSSPGSRSRWKDA
jgi:hypothetical protein